MRKGTGKATSPLAGECKKFGGKAKRMWQSFNNEPIASSSEYMTPFSEGISTFPNTLVKLEPENSQCLVFRRGDTKYLRATHYGE